MLSNHENRERMRCKLVENLQFDSHFEASRLRDYSGYSSYFNADNTACTSTLAESTKETIKAKDLESSKETAEHLTEKLQLNKQAINDQINGDFIGEEEFLLNNPSNQGQQSAAASTATRGNESKATNASLSQSSTAASSTTSNHLLNQNLKSVPPQEHIDLFAKLEEKEKLLIKAECELITVTRVIKGRFELTNKYIYFFDTFSSFYCEQTSSANDSNEAVNNLTQNGGANLTSCQPGVSFCPGIANSAGFSCHDFEILNDFKISLAQLKEVQLRRYNLRRSALEFFLIDQSNFFINFNKNVNLFNFFNLS